ncbi:unknown [Clostridium sp. CAG:354]|jgi:hypothetical protein|uniref:hypothetical protein n=1 Tax=Candidatus Merdicola sp. TaxID=3085652 RepID=UPI0003408DF6|nr:hypothetical protein [Clostridium sp.]MEE0269160.1 hypothetical protein [Clostridia bacterium]OKZ60177.1 MAG: hypothetical protein BHV96_03055 [Clostridium sp. CAG:354_28_25]CDE10040.1 unknown [Clostridium sp. CAG:354]
MKEEYVELATEIVEDQLATVINEYAVSQNQQANKLLEQKIEILQQMKGEINKGNSNIIKMVLKRKKKGII